MAYVVVSNTSTSCRLIFSFRRYSPQIRVKRTASITSGVFTFALFPVSSAVSSQLRLDTSVSVLVKTKIKAMIGRPSERKIKYKRMQGNCSRSERSIPNTLFNAYSILQIKWIYVPCSLFITWKKPTRETMIWILLFKPRLNESIVPTTAHR